MSRQTDWQKRRRDLGLCRQCGAQARGGKARCEMCEDKNYAAKRKKVLTARENATNT